ncbi:MAG: hypothetical protein PWP04_791 [Candidatus Atribacteria bacterium]|nr:hypothetical protein [Candidatus Atribacteria bacterium]
MKRLLLVICVFSLASLVFLTGCAGTPPGPSPSPPPNQTQSPQLITISDGTRNLESGDRVRPGLTVTFTGQGPANVTIRVYQEGEVFDTTATDGAGRFTWAWVIGATEGTFDFQFTAKDPALEESDPVVFSVIVDGTPPYLLSGSAKPDSPLGEAPTITVSFNEPIEVSDINLFTVPGYWAVSMVLPLGGNFTLTQIGLGGDNQTVTLTGDWTADQLITGEILQVVFVPHPAMGITDQAGNPMALPTTIQVTVAP